MDRRKFLRKLMVFTAGLALGIPNQPYFVGWKDTGPKDDIDFEATIEMIPEILGEVYKAVAVAVNESITNNAG